MKEKPKEISKRGDCFTMIEMDIRMCDTISECTLIS